MSKLQHEKINKSKKGIYVIRKYILAGSALEAIKLDKKKPVDDVWLDEESKKQFIGFNIDQNGGRK
ncbi:MAG TPA: hypothetical protein PKV66_05210 [Candidatus Pelethenecus sp.]|nr:hypothetical protein [Candidatus Pelethenecus sp.]